MSEENGLPNGWVWSTVGEIAHVGTGTTPSRTKSGFWSEGRIPWITSSAVNQPFVSEAEQFVTDEALASTTLKVYPKDTLIVALYGEGKTRGKVSELLIDATINQALAALRLHIPDQAHRRFVKYFLQGNYAVLRRQAAGGMQPNLNLSLVNRIRVPVAPLNEQRRIVAKIEELFSDLDAGVAALKRAKANLKRYRAAVLKAAVEGKLTEEWRAKHPKVEPASKLLERILTERRNKWETDQLAKFAAAEKEPPKNWRDKYVEPSPPDTTDLPELPDGWCWAKFDQLLTYLRNGYFQSPSGADSGTPILRINAVRQMKVDLAETRFLNEIEGSVDDYFIENGDLLFTRYNGSVDLLGVAGMVRGCTEKVLHPDKLIRIKLALGEPMPSFCEIAVNVGASRKHMAGRARTTAGQTGISGPDVREMPIPLPPLDEQSCINVEVAEKLSLMEAAETAIDHGLLRAARLRQSILKEAFEGKLVPQVPNDEPATMLLERIKEKSPNGDVKPTALKHKRSK